MILVALILLVLTTLGVASLVALQGRSTYREYRAEQANLERQKRWAERRLHDVSSKAFESMLDAARQASVTDQSWWSGRP
jgi:hypothetical protein